MEAQQVAEARIGAGAAATEDIPTRASTVAAVAGALDLLREHGPV